MTDTRDLLTAYDEQLRGAGQAGPDTVHDYDGLLLRVTGWHQGFVSTPRDVGVRGAELDALIARQRDWFAARGESVEWKTRGHDEPADLTDRLLAAGFVAEERETVILGETAKLACEPVLPDGVTLRQTTDPGDLHRIGDLWTTVWGQDMSFIGPDLVRRTTDDPDGIVVLVAEAGGEIVSAAWLVLPEGCDFAGLWGGSTLAEWRRRGIYRALVARRAQIAAERGFRYLHVDASDDSSPILQQLGLHAVTTTTPYVWKPPAA